MRAHSLQVRSRYNLSCILKRKKIITKQKRPTISLFLIDNNFDSQTVFPTVHCQFFVALIRPKKKQNKVKHCTQHSTAPQHIASHTNQRKLLSFKVWSREPSIVARQLWQRKWMEMAIIWYVMNYLFSTYYLIFTGVHLEMPFSLAFRLDIVNYFKPIK